MYSDNMKISASHEWLRLENDHLGVIGITHYAQELLGDVVYVELPKVGQVVQAQQSVGVIESAKAASDLYSPVSGEIVAINETVVADPSLVNQAPHSEGWLFKLRLTDLAEIAALQSPQDYQQSIGA